MRYVWNFPRHGNVLCTGLLTMSVKFGNDWPATMYALFCFHKKLKARAFTAVVILFSISLSVVFYDESWRIEWCQLFRLHRLIFTDKHRKLYIFCEFAKMFEKWSAWKFWKVINMQCAICVDTESGNCGRVGSLSMERFRQWTRLLKTKSARLAYFSEAKPGPDRLEIYLSLNWKSHKKMLTLFSLKGYIELRWNHQVRDCRVAVQDQ